LGILNQAVIALLPFLDQMKPMLPFRILLISSRINEISKARQTQNRIGTALAFYTKWEK
jgi:hypothetical protein